MVRAELALQLEELIAAKAKENRVEAGRQAALEQHGRVVQNSAQPITPIKTRDEVAKLAGVSHDTISKVKAIKASGNRAAVSR